MIARNSSYKIFKKVIQDNDTSQVKRLNKGAREYLNKKMVEFCENLIKNSIENTKAVGRKTLFEKDVADCLDSLSYVLKNMPKR